MSASASFAPVRIRAAAIGDAADVARLIEQLGYPCTRDEAADRIAHVLGDPRQQLLLAEVDGQACGLASIDVRYSLTRGGDQARITALVVDRAHARRGIGRALLREIEAIGRHGRVTRIEVTSNMRRDEAHAFYRDCGYSEGSRHFFKPLGD